MSTTMLDLEREMAAAISELDDVVARVSGLACLGGVQALAPAVLPSAVLGLVRASDRLQAVAAESVARVHAGGELPIATTTWLQNEAGLSKGAASSLLALACSLATDYGATSAAWVAAASRGPTPARSRSRSTPSPAGSPTTSSRRSGPWPSARCSTTRSRAPPRRSSRARPGACGPGPTSGA